MKFELPKLNYAYNELEPAIDAMTVEIHYDRHHRAYVNNLNDALSKYPDLFTGKTVEEILANLDLVPQDIRQTVINNGGGYVNHNLYWSILKPNGGGRPTGKLLEAIETQFGSFEKFQEEVNNAAKTVFGSGWAFVVVNKENKLQVLKYANQNSPISDGLTPIFGIDVWEHAYYLKYQNKRPDYINNFWTIVNWDEVERRFLEVVNN